MKKIFKIFILWTVIFPLLYLGQTIYFTNYHELAHQAVYDYYWINSTVEWRNPFINRIAETIPTTNTSRCGSSCATGHHMVEAVGYQLQAAVDILLAMMFFYMSFKIARDE